MDTAELIHLANPIIGKIRKCRDLRVLAELFNSPQPLEWVELGESPHFAGEKFAFNRIQLIEGLLDQVFDEYHFKDVQTIITTDRNGIAVTTTLLLRVMINWPSKSDTGYFQNIYPGVASLTTKNIFNLQLLIPQCYTQAKKHAARQIGDLFGKSLNRQYDDYDFRPLNEKVPDSNPIDLAFETLKELLTNAGSYESAKEILSGHPSWKYNKELQDIVNKKIKPSL